MSDHVGMTEREDEQRKSAHDVARRALRSAAERLARIARGELALSAGEGILASVKYALEVMHETAEPRPKPIGWDP